MYPVGQQQHGNLPPQAQRTTCEERDAAAEYGQLFFHRLLDPREFLLQPLAHPAVLDRPQHRIGHT
jgi:hypothetical protein